MSSRNFFDLAAIKQTQSSGGNIVRVTVDEMPGLVNISFSDLKLNKRGFLNPIWHPNANKIGFCLQGNAWVCMRTPSGVEEFTISKGEVFFIPKGFVHYIANIGDQDAHIIFALDNQNPEEMNVFQAVHSLSESVFNSTFNSSPNFYQGLIKSKKLEQISIISQSKTSDFVANRYKFNINASTKSILTKGGYLQAATKTNLPVLDGLGILSFGMNRQGAVEPHWHTNAGELIYIIKGTTRITVLAPDGKIDNLEVKGGQGAFAAASHFHNIENIGDEDVEVMAFFSHADPDFIGIGEVIGSYSNEVLASIFNVSPQFFDQFKKPTGPLVIVPVPV